ncbi:MAG: 16S rRNA (cytidine(1402)-2'-O)-methyltransferase [Clostridia bacterium]|nr:16S rRNA (cytidine(1402)-2'-O)-methyltransferase [Clostridia bacterium]
MPLEIEKNKTEKGVLYLVATPIGNLSDISERALKVLSEVDFVAAEDTRNSAKLLSCYGISKPMISYHQHNRSERGPVICNRLKSGESCALVTDAGSPAISDPGEDLVRLCADEGIKVSFIPGACAAIGALAMSGLATGRFAFEGFIGGTKSERKQRLTSLAKEERTLIFYEAPHHLRATLSDMLTAFGDRRITLCREMTKLNEEIIRTTLKNAVTLYEKTEPRGEYVLILEGNSSTSEGNEFWQEMTVRQHVEYYMELGQDKNTAIKSAAKDRGVHKSEIYKQVL